MPCERELGRLGASGEHREARLCEAIRAGGSLSFGRARSTDFSVTREGELSRTER